MVEIDLEKVEDCKLINVSTSFGARHHGLEDQAALFATQHKEVILCSASGASLLIPPSALLTVILKQSMLSDQQRSGGLGMEAFCKEMPIKIHKCIFVELYKPPLCSYPENHLDTYHFNPDCPEANDLVTRVTQPRGRPCMMCMMRGGGHKPSTKAAPVRLTATPPAWSRPGVQPGGRRNFSSNAAPTPTPAFFFTETGAKYHRDAQCYGLKKATRTIQSSATRPQGKEPCKICAH